MASFDDMRFSVALSREPDGLNAAAHMHARSPAANSALSGTEIVAIDRIQYRHIHCG
jgi:hypothetical protein